MSLDIGALWPVIKPLVVEAVAEALNKALPKAITTPGEVWQQAYKDLWNATREAMWNDVEEHGHMIRRCLRCKGEGDNHKPGCVLYAYTRDGKREVKP